MGLATDDRGSGVTHTLFAGVFVRIELSLRTQFRRSASLSGATLQQKRRRAGGKVRIAPFASPRNPTKPGLMMFRMRRQ